MSRADVEFLALREENTRLKNRLNSFAICLIAAGQRYQTFLAAYALLESQYRELDVQSRRTIDLLNATIAQVEQELSETQRELNALKVQSSILNQSNRQLASSLCEASSERAALLSTIRDLESKISGQAQSASRAVLFTAHKVPFMNLPNAVHMRFSYNDCTPICYGLYLFFASQVHANLFREHINKKVEDSGIQSLYLTESPQHEIVDGADVWVQWVKFHPCYNGAQTAHPGHALLEALKSIVDIQNVPIVYEQYDKVTKKFQAILNAQGVPVNTFEDALQALSSQGSLAPSL